MFQLRQDDFIKPPETIKMKVILSSQEMHGEQQAHQSEVVITMQMTDEDVVDFMMAEVVSLELQLAGLSAVN